MVPVPHDPSVTTAPVGGYFPTTHWSVVIHAGEPNGGSTVAVATEQLCRTYWYPLYAYLRRKGFSLEDAQDHVQSFLAQLLENESLQKVSRGKGKFRSFLLASLNHYVSDQRDRAAAQKRGGGREIISIDAVAAEGRYNLEPADVRSPDRIYERGWALTVLDRVLERLEGEYKSSGNHALFQRIRGFLVDDPKSDTYAAAGPDLGKSEGAIKKSVQRLRRRYAELFREEIANTVENVEQVEDEINHFRRIMTEE